MDSIRVALTELSGFASHFSASAIDYLPRMIGALVFFAVGWYLAKFASAASRRMLRSFNVFLNRRWRARFGKNARLSPTVITISAAIIRWALLLFVVIGMARILGIEVLTVWLGRASEQIPSVVAGGIIVFVGVVLSRFARDIVEIVLSPTMGTQSLVFGRLAQGMVIISALIMGVDLTGIDTTFLVSFVTIFLASLFGGMAIAFGLGAKDLVANVIGIHHAQKTFVIGQNVKIGTVQGEIVHITPTTTVISTAEGKMVFPGGIFQREGVLISNSSETSYE